VHVLEGEFVARIPDGPCDIVRTAYAALVAAGGPVLAHVLREGAFFAENSTPERYLAANLALLDGGWQAPFPAVGVDPAAAVDATAEIEPPVRVAAEARIGGGARLHRCVVGRGAVVQPGARVRGAVLWPGSVAGGEVARCIVTPRGRVDVT
jgi:UDP-3-O-[3-hydroxymyristoyl] glucosamine N-acyltransferase